MAAEPTPESVAPPPERAWRPFPPQERFLRSAAFEAMFAGASGPGKTSVLLAGAARYIGVSTYRAGIFRRTVPELEGADGIVERSQEFYRPLGGVYLAQKRIWYFPSGARIHLCACEHENDRFAYRGWAWQYCVARDTRVLMASGEWRRIQDVRAGDEVATLLGPRPVTRTHALGNSPCVRLRHPAAEVVVSAMHPILTGSGWVSPSELLSTGYRESFDMLGSSPDTCRESFGLQPCRSWDQPRASLPAQPLAAGTHRPDSVASRVGDRSDFGAFGDVHQEAWPPQRCFFRAVLLARAAQSTALGALGRSPLRVPGDVRDGSSLEDSPTCCPTGRRCRDGQSRRGGATGRGSTLRSAYAETSTRPCSRADDPMHFRRYTRSEALALRHPYTNEPMAVSEAVLDTVAEILPGDEAEVFDLTVAGASHYVTWGGFIARNCGIDEASGFTERIVLFLLSRLRSTAGLPCFARYATNPGGVGHSFLLARFAPWLYRPGVREDEFAGPYAKPGEVLWFKRDGASGEERIVPIGTPGAISRTFVPARLEDNPVLAATDYGTRLEALDPLTRRQLRDGDWMARAEPGALFRREWVRTVAAPLERAVARVRYWDRAASGADKRRSDWTAGVRMARADDGTLVVEDVVRARLDPGGVLALIVETAQRDLVEVGLLEQTLELDPGQAGEAELAMYRREFAALASGGGDARHLTVRGVRPRGSKVDRFKPFSAHAAQGSVAVVAGPWLAAFLDELEAFPTGHDDQADAASGASGALATGVRIVASPWRGLAASAARRL